MQTNNKYLTSIVDENALFFWFMAVIYNKF